MPYISCFDLIMNLISIAFSFHIFQCLLLNVFFTFPYSFIQFNVGGAMELWGLTIDTVTSVQLIVAIGLAVDYSAHVGHKFMTIAGNRNGNDIKIILIYYF